MSQDRSYSHPAPRGFARATPNRVGSVYTNDPYSEKLPPYFDGRRRSKAKPAESIP